MFFVSVADKGVTEAILVSVADKGFTGRRFRLKHGKTRRSFVSVAAKGVTEDEFVSVADKRLGRIRGGTEAGFE